MLNSCCFIGFLGSDPELRQTSGDPVCNLSLGVTEKWTDKSGEKKEKTEWVRISVWGKTAENCEKYLQKGSPVYVQGRLSTRKWTDKQGNEKFTTEITADKVVFLPDPKKNRDSGNGGGGQRRPDEDRGQRREEPRGTSGGGGRDKNPGDGAEYDPDGDIPFASNVPWNEYKVMR